MKSEVEIKARFYSIRNYFPYSTFGRGGGWTRIKATDPLSAVKKYTKVKYKTRCLDFQLDGKNTPLVYFIREEKFAPFILDTVWCLEGLQFNSFWDKLIWYLFQK